MSKKLKRAADAAYEAKLASSGLDLSDAELLGMSYLSADQVLKLNSKFQAVPGLLIPYYDFHGKPLSYRPHHDPFWRLRYLGQATDFASLTATKRPRYTQAPGTGVCAYFPKTVDWRTFNMGPDSAEHSILLEKWNLAPRISFAYKFPDKSQISVAYGMFYQDPERKYLPSVNALHFQKATHYIAQYEKISSNRTFRTELFYKKYDDLIKTAGAYNETFTAINNNGFGEAKGIEFFWRDKKTIKDVDYWISYSYIDTKRDFLNYPFALEPSFVSKHTASLVVKKFVMPIKTQFNMSYTFASGRPYYDLVYNNSNSNYKMLESGRTKDYNNLSFSINYLPTIGKPKAKAFSVFVFSVTNVLGFANVYNYNFSVNGQNKVAVTPPSKRFIYLGYFVSLGIDRTQDEINNHL